MSTPAGETTYYPEVEQSDRLGAWSGKSVPRNPSGQVKPFSIVCSAITSRFLIRAKRDRASPAS